MAALARPALVVDVSPAGSGDVFDLAIEDPAHAFAVNDGLVVSNCYDALRYLLMGLARLGAGTQAGPHGMPSGATPTGAIGELHDDVTGLGGLTRRGF